MGLAASQARLLSLTSRIHDVEYQAQMVQSAKLQLALTEDEVFRKYNEALDATTLTYKAGDSRIPANFNNLCGLASIDNGMNTHFVFRTGNDKTRFGDRLIVPNDVYEGYKEYGGEDPYEFAMYMLGVEPEFVKNAEEEYTNNLSDYVGDTIKDKLDGLHKTMEAQFKDITDALGLDYETTYQDIVVEGGSIEELTNSNDKNYDEVMKLIDKYNATQAEYKYTLYHRGAENIYQKATEKEDFDYSKYDYYLRWGMLIKQEVGINNCVKESDYGEDFGNDSNTLKEMLETGRIIIETVQTDSKGKITDSTTSVASDSNLQYTQVEANSKEVKKAEAEYEHAMKEINRKDKRYDMDLNRLETERTALTTEYESVKKVIQDNVERTFGIFS